MKKLTISALIGAALTIMSPMSVADSWIAQGVTQDSNRLTEIFEHFHANPEVGFMEFNSARVIAEELTSLGFEVHEGIAHTGVAGILRNGDGPTVMFRADMDALPIKEETDLPYKATNTTKNRLGQDIYAMHACGHDTHMTWLLGVAKQLTQNKDKWSGTVILIGQPAEELIMGADAMVKDGLYDKVPVPDILIAGHVHPVLPAGTVAISDGRRMAGTDQIDITIQGVGGHGSTPHVTKDPVVMAAQSVMGYQTVISRMVDQAQPAVLTIGAIIAGNENNIIPDSATLKANLRWFRMEDRERMIKGIKSVTDNVARMYGVSEDNMPTYEMKGFSTPVINPTHEAQIAREAMSKHLGKDNVLNGFPATMGSEDFHMLTHGYPEVPVVFLEVGAATQQTWDALINEGKQPKYMNHNPNFVVEQGAIPTGTIAATAVVQEFLNKK
ncbi:amidohydrolase [Shewanella gaetbuli]